MVINKTKFLLHIQFDKDIKETDSIWIRKDDENMMIAPLNVHTPKHVTIKTIKLNKVNSELPTPLLYKRKYLIFISNADGSIIKYNISTDEYQLFSKFDFGFIIHIKNDNCFFLY